jgi:hypothetical protein
MGFMVSTLSQKEVACSKPAYLQNACRILLRNCGKKKICRCAPDHTDVWRSAGIGPCVINLWHDIDWSVEPRSQAPVPPSEFAVSTPTAYVIRSSELV